MSRKSCGSCNTGPWWGCCLYLPHLIRKYQANSGTAMWFRTYMWGVIYLRWAPWGFWGVCCPP